MILRIVIVILGISYTSAADVVPVVPAPATTPALLLSPYIKQQKLQEAKNASLVTASLFLNITSHAGFLTVNETYNSNLFFWYFPVAGKQVNETPWIIWLQGVPGGSSLTGLFDEIGPFQYENGTLKTRESSWAANYSMLFIDNPVGSGYSFTNSKDGFVKNMEQCASHLYSALQQFLTIFPELRTAPLYVAGESYAGRYVPAFGYKIYQEQLRSNLTAKVNFKGVMMGDPVVDRIDAANLSSVYYHWGLLDSQGLLAAKPLQDQYSQAIRDNNVEKAFELRDKLLDLLDAITQQPSRFNVLKGPGDLYGYESYLARPDVSVAIHVGSINFASSNRSVDSALMKDFLGPIQPKIENLLEHCKVLIYCGQLDLAAPCELGAAARRERWRWSRRADFLKAPRLPWLHNGTMAGYIKQGGGLTEALVRASGHHVPIDAPAQTKELILAFISNQTAAITDSTTNKAEYTPMIPEAEDEVLISKKEQTHGSGLLIASIVMNVILSVALILALLYYLWWRSHRDENGHNRVFYSPLSTE